MKHKLLVDPGAVETVLERSTMGAAQRRNVLKHHCLIVQLPGLVFSYSGEQVCSPRVVLSVAFFQLIRSRSFYISLMGNPAKDVLDSEPQDCPSMVAFN